MIPTILCAKENIKTFGLVVSDKKIYSCFPYISLCKTCDPEFIHIWPQGINYKTIGNGPLGDATVPMPCGFRQKYIFYVFPI